MPNNLPIFPPSPPQAGGGGTSPTHSAKDFVFNKIQASLPSPAGGGGGVHKLFGTAIEKNIPPPWQGEVNTV